MVRQTQIFKLEFMKELDEMMDGLYSAGVMDYNYYATQIKSMIVEANVAGYLDGYEDGLHESDEDRTEKVPVLWDVDIYTVVGDTKYMDIHCYTGYARSEEEARLDALNRLYAKAHEEGTEFVITAINAHKETEEEMGYYAETDR